jgi:hypothetical protein
MANLIPLLENLTKADIREFMNACVSFDAKNILGPEYEEVVSYGIPKMGLYWKTKKDFEKDIKIITRTKSIVEANKVLEKRLPSAPEGPPKSIPTESERESQEAERARREASQKRAVEESKENVETAKKRKEELAKEASEKWTKLQQQKTLEVAPKDTQEMVLQELNGKTLYAVPEKQPPQITLSSDEQKLIKIAKTNPHLFVDKLSKLIIERNPEIPPETLQPLSQIVAVDVTQSFIDPTKKVVPTGVFASISKTGTQIPGLSQVAQTEISKTSSFLTVFSDNQEDLYRTLLVRSVGVNLTNKVLGFPETTYKLSETPSEDSFALKLDQIQANSFSLQEDGFSELLNNPVLDFAKSTAKSRVADFALSKIKSLPQEGFLGQISRFVSSRSFDSIAPFLGLPTQATYIGTNFFGKAITTLLPEYAPLISNLTGKMGIDLGIKAVAPAIIEKAAGSAITATGAKVAGGLISKITTVLGGLGSWATFGLSLVAGYLIGKVIEKIPWDKIKKFFKDYGGPIGVAFLGGGVMLRSIPMIAISAPFLYTGWVGARNLTAFGRNIGNFFRLLGTALIIRIGTPVLVAILVFPVVVALILFIINSGAYVVPPSGSTVFENPYISVEKTANPKGPFENTALPLTVEYTIKITAKISPLTNVNLDYKCKVLRKDSIPPCPDIGDAIPGTDEIGTISPSSSYSFKYTMTYSGDSFKDSVILDIITATADTPEKSGVTTSGSATIIIGKPDIGCYKPLTTGPYAIPTQYMSMYNEAIFKIVEDWPAYVAKTCASSWGDINIGYGGPNPYWGWHLHEAAVDFILYQQPVSTTLVRTEFTMLHELGHHIHDVNPVYLIQYIDYPGIVISICTYSATQNGDMKVRQKESFSETMGLYGSSRSLSDSMSCAGETATFKEKYPVNWRFADTVMFH